MVSKMLRFCSLFAYQIWFVLNNIQYCDGTRASALTKPSMVLINHHPSRQLLWHLQKQVTWIHTLHTRGRPHTFESLLSKWRSVCPGWIKIGPDSCLCLTVGNLDSKIPLLYEIKSQCFQLWSEPQVLSRTKLSFKMDVYTGKKKKPASKPSSPRLDTCEDQNSFTSAHRSPFGNLHHFWMFAASPSSPTVGISCTTALTFTTSVPESRQDVVGTPRESSTSIIYLNIATGMTIFRAPCELYHYIR